MAKSIIQFNPIQLAGNWKTGWALDYHTISSRYDKAAGFFKTNRTDLGEALYKLKFLLEGLGRIVCLNLG